MYAENLQCVWSSAGSRIKTPRLRRSVDFHRKLSSVLPSKSVWVKCVQTSTKSLPTQLQDGGRKAFVCPTKQEHFTNNIGTKGNSLLFLFRNKLFRNWWSHMSVTLMQVEMKKEYLSNALEAIWHKRWNYNLFHSKHLPFWLCLNNCCVNTFANNSQIYFHSWPGLHFEDCKQSSFVFPEQLACMPGAFEGGQLARTTHSADQWLSERIPRLLSMYFFLQVSSPELLREALVTKQDIFSGRAAWVRMLPYLHHQEDVGFASDTQTWKITKKAFVTSIKMWE